MNSLQANYNRQRLGFGTNVEIDKKVRQDLSSEGKKDLKILTDIFKKDGNEKRTICISSIEKPNPGNNTVKIIVYPSEDKSCPFYKLEDYAYTNIEGFERRLSKTIKRFKDLSMFLVK